MWLGPSTVAIGKGACSWIAWQRPDRSGDVGPQPDPGSATKLAHYFLAFAFGSGAASSSCFTRGPVRWGIPVVNPM